MGDGPFDEPHSYGQMEAGVQTYEHNRGGSLPARIAARPSPDQWGADELLTLNEAAKLFWPSGPLTTRSLRTAAETGRLPVVVVARKMLTTKRAIEEMSRCEKRPRCGSGTARDRRPSDGGAARRDGGSAYDRLMRKLAEQA
jgi:hypothetical protein